MSTEKPVSSIQVPTTELTPNGAFSMIGCSLIPIPLTHSVYNHVVHSHLIASLIPSPSQFLIVCHCARALEKAWFILSCE